MLALPGPPGWTPEPFSYLYTPPRPVFPVEVFERIIDFCAHPANLPNALSDSRATLRIWALTCTALLRRSRYHLWREIRLRDAEEVNTLVRTLRNNTHIHTFIRFLDVWLDAPSSIFTSLMIAKLPHLQYIHISGERPLRHKVFFPTMKQFKTVTMLWISFRIQAQQLMRLLCCFPDLQFLRLDGEDDCYAPIPRAKHYAPKFQLECLQFKFCSRESQIKAWRYVLQCLADAPGCLNSLKILDLDFHDTWDGMHFDMERISFILSAAHASLSEVVITHSHDWSIEDQGDNFPNAINFLSFSDNAALRRLIVRFDWVGQKDLSGLLQVLQNIPTGVLEYLAMEFRKMSLLEIDSLWWQDLDKLLCSDRFKSLRSVELSYSDGRFAEVLTGLKAKGILKLALPSNLPVGRWMRRRDFWL